MLRFISLVLCILVASCSSAKTTANSSTATFGDCDINLRQICEAYIHQPTFTLNGAQTNATQLAQNGNPHTQIWMPFSYPNGDLIANLECMINTQNLSASYARLLPGPPITDKEVQYAKGLGLCTDSSGVTPAIKNNLGDLTRDGS